MSIGKVDFCGLIQFACFRVDDQLVIFGNLWVNSQGVFDILSL